MSSLLSSPGDLMMDIDDDTTPFLELLDYCKKLVVIRLANQFSLPPHESSSDSLKKFTPEVVQEYAYQYIRIIMDEDSVMFPSFPISQSNPLCTSFAQEVMAAKDPETIDLLSNVIQNGFAPLEHHWILRSGSVVSYVRMIYTCIRVGELPNSLDAIRALERWIGILWQFESMLPSGKPETVVITRDSILQTPAHPHLRLQMFVYHSYDFLRALQIMVSVACHLYEGHP